MMLDYSHLPRNISSSTQTDAVSFRRAYARASNAIEGVVLSASDITFMESISPTISQTDFTKAVLNHLNSKA